MNVVVPGPARLQDAPSTPWRVSDMGSMILSNLVALTLIVSGYVLARYTTDPARMQIAITLAAGGLIVEVAGNLLWLFNSLREVTGLRRALLRSGDQVAYGSETPPSIVAPHGGLVSSSAMTRYHRPDCPLVQGKPVSSAALSAHRRAGRTPCPVCQADEEPTS